MNHLVIHVKCHKRRRKSTSNRLRYRSGKSLVLLAILLPTLLAIVGLVLDGGLMITEHRSLQNVADAAATAAAVDLRLGKTSSQATTTATDLIASANSMPEVDVSVSIPPASGPFAGISGHVEVVVETTYESQIMRIVNGIFSHSLRVRAVAGVEEVTDNAAIVVLDPDPLDLSITGLNSLLLGIDVGALAEAAVEQSGLVEAVENVPVVGPIAAPLLDTELVSCLTDETNQLWIDTLGEVSLLPLPSLLAGLEVEGLGQLIVDDAVLVNNEWGGVDENGDPAGNSAGPPYGITCMPILPLTNLRARDIRVCGGVDNQDNYSGFDDGDENPLQANRLPVPDPFRNLAPPSIATDPTNVDPTLMDPADVVRIALPTDTANNLLNVVLGKLPPLLAPLFQPLIDSLEEQLTVVTLQPGVYNSLVVLAPLGGVHFEPGVYIIRGTSVDAGIPLLIVGPVRAEGVMFYITDSASYDVSTGLPDAGETADSSPPDTPVSNVVSAAILPLLPGARLTGLNDPGSPYDGMLVYQRRMDRRPIIFEAQQLLGGGDVSGTIYSKWGHVLFLSGNGTYDLRFVAGTMRVLTIADTVLAPTHPLPAAQDVLLVE